MGDVIQFPRPTPVDDGPYHPMSLAEMDAMFAWLDEPDEPDPEPEPVSRWPWVVLGVCLGLWL